MANHMSMPKLTGPQLAMLRRLAQGPEMTPGGTPDSGRQASAWHRTLDVLVRRGLATRTTNGCTAHATITDAGRVWVDRPPQGAPTWWHCNGHVYLAAGDDDLGRANCDRCGEQFGARLTRPCPVKPQSAPLAAPEDMAGDDTCPCGRRYGEYGHDH